MIHCKRKMWRTEEGWVGQGSERQERRLGCLIGIGGKSEPQGLDKVWKV